MGAPLSQFYKSGNLIFISGQVGKELETGVIPQDFEAQAKNTLLNLKARLIEAGVEEDAVVKTTVYLTDLSLFGKMNELYVEFFGDPKPARTTIGVAGLPQFPGDPQVFIEIDAIAEIKD